MNQQYRKYLSAFVLIMLITVQSKAVRHVGNGGGLNEMKLLFVHQNFSQILTPCLNTYNFCNLTQGEIETLSLVVAQQTNESSTSKINFSEELFEPFGFETQRSIGSDVQISSSTLYDSKDEPKSYNDLVSLILQVRLYHLSKDLYHVSIAKKLNILNEETHTINFGHFKLHTMRITENTNQTNNNDLAALFIEDANSTYDITQKLMDLIGVEKGFEFNLLNSYSTVDLSSNRRYSMWGPLSNIAKKPGLNNSILVIELTLNSNNLVEEKSISLKLK